MLKDSVCCIIFCHCCVCGIVIPRCSPSALCGVFRSICKNKLFSLKTGDFHEKNTIGADNLSEFRSYTGETGSKSLQRCLVARGNAHSTGIGCPHLGHRSEQLVCRERSSCLLRAFNLFAVWLLVTAMRRHNTTPKQTQRHKTKTIA